MEGGLGANRHTGVRGLMASVHPYFDAVAPGLGRQADAADLVLGVVLRDAEAR